MVKLYEISDPASRQVFVDLAHASREPGISTRYRELSETFREYLDWENYADELYMYETKVVPGPIQNGGYANAVVREMSEGAETSRLTAIVDARNERATYLTGPGGPPSRYILDESCLHRAVGGEDLPWGHKYSTMLRVIDHLKNLNTVGRSLTGDVIDENLNPRISVQVVPLERGAYAALTGPFVLLEFENSDDSSLVYLEHPNSEELVEGSTTETYKNRFDTLAKSIPGPEITNQILDYIRESYSTRESEMRSILKDSDL